MKKGMQKIWEYPVVDKHPELSLILIAIIAPFFYFGWTIYDILKQSQKEVKKPS